MAKSAPESWRRLVAELRPRIEAGASPKLYIIGAVDVGKSTLASYLLRELSESGRRIAFIDGDPGQSVLGPPSTVGSALWTEMGAGARQWQEPSYRFVGAPTPMGHLLQTAVGLRRLSDHHAAAPTIIDSAGFVTGAVAREFQYNLIELLRPTHLIILGEIKEANDAAHSFYRDPSVEIHNASPAPEARTRGQEERRRYRQQRYQEYFRKAEEQELALERVGWHGRVPPLDSIGEVKDRLCGLCDQNQDLLSLILTGEPSNGKLRFWGPRVEPEAVATVQFGSVRLDPREMREERL